jgi:hypothetical protein
MVWLYGTWSIKRKKGCALHTIRASLQMQLALVQAEGQTLFNLVRTLLDQGESVLITARGECITRFRLAPTPHRNVVGIVRRNLQVTRRSRGSLAMCVAYCCQSDGRLDKFVVAERQGREDLWMHVKLEAHEATKLREVLTKYLLVHT